MKRLILYTVLFVISFGCIKNDLPLPVVTPRIVSMEVEGATSVEINSEQRIVYVTLDEVTDITKVNIHSISFEDDRTTTSFDTTVAHNLSQPVTLTLSIYQDYEWRIVTTQPIKRYFTVADQVGSTEMDGINRRVLVYVKSNVDKRNVSVTSIKLGPKDITTYSPSVDKMKNFVNGLDVVVTSHGRSETWKLFVENTTTVVEMKSVNAWTGIAWVSAMGVAGLDNGFKYRWLASPDYLRMLCI